MQNYSIFVRCSFFYLIIVQIRLPDLNRPYAWPAVSKNWERRYAGLIRFSVAVFTYCHCWQAVMVQIRSHFLTYLSTDLTCKLLCRWPQWCRLGLPFSLTYLPISRVNYCAGDRLSIHFQTLGIFYFRTSQRQSEIFILRIS